MSGSYWAELYCLCGSAHFDSTMEVVFFLASCQVKLSSIQYLVVCIFFRNGADLASLATTSIIPVDLNAFILKVRYRISPLNVD